MVASEPAASRAAAEMNFIVDVLDIEKNDHLDENEAFHFLEERATEVKSEEVAIYSIQAKKMCGVGRRGRTPSILGSCSIQGLSLREKEKGERSFPQAHIFSTISLLLAMLIADKFVHLLLRCRLAIVCRLLQEVL